MRTLRKSVLLALGFVLVSFLFIQARSQKQAPQVQTPSAAEERARLLAIGKKLFMERCAKCHDERGDKPLKTGPPLNERDLPEEQIARAVSGRFRDKSEEEKRAVALYVTSFMKRK